MNKRAKYSSKQIANWFINRFIQDVPNGGEYLTQLKLQKLMYFAQGFSLILNDKPLFKGRIIHRQYGPVVEDLATYFMEKKQGVEPLKDLIEEKEVKLTEEENALLELVYKKFGQFSSYKLVEISHMTKPWIDTNEGDVISLEEIDKFFRESFLANGEK